MDTELYQNKKDELEKLKKERKERLSSIKYGAIASVGFGGIGVAAYNMFKGIPHGPLDVIAACSIFSLLCYCAGADAVSNAVHAKKTGVKIKSLERELE